MQLIYLQIRLGVFVLFFMLVRLIPSIEGLNFLPRLASSWINIAYVQMYV